MSNEIATRSSTARLAGKNAVSASVIPISIRAAARQLRNFAISQYYWVGFPTAESVVAEFRLADRSSIELSNLVGKAYRSGYKPRN